MKHTPTSLSNGNVRCTRAPQPNTELFSPTQHSHLRQSISHESPPGFSL